MEQVLREKVLDKIEKLLALSKSPNEHEAKAALMKAQELLAKHNMTMGDVDANDQPSKDIENNMSNSKGSSAWFRRLASVMATEHRCAYYLTSFTGSKASYITFIGYKDDVQVCLALFDYISKFIDKEGIKKSIEHRKITGSADGYRDQYGLGFVEGLALQYRENRKSHESEWGLVLVTPKEVTDHLSQMNLKKAKSVTYKNGPADGRLAGRADGMSFSTSDKLNG